MNKLIQSYKVFSIIEISLLIYVLYNMALIGSGKTSEYVELGEAFILIIIPLIFGWRILWLTTKGIRASETFIIIGHISNFIKLMPLGLLVWEQIYFQYFIIG